MIRERASILGYMYIAYLGIEEAEYITYSAHKYARTCIYVYRINCSQLYVEATFDKKNSNSYAIK